MSVVLGITAGLLAYRSTRTRSWSLLIASALVLAMAYLFMYLESR